MEEDSSNGCTSSDDNIWLVRKLYNNNLLLITRCCRCCCCCCSCCCCSPPSPYRRANLSHSHHTFTLWHLSSSLSLFPSFPLSLFPSFSQLSQGAEHKGPGLPNRVAGGYSSFLFFPHSPHLFSAFPHSQNRVASGSHGMAAQKSDRGTFTLIKGPFQPEFCPKTEPKALSGLTKTEGSLH